MKSFEITASFGPGAVDRAALSRSCRATLETIYRHPLAHGLEWSDVLTLFAKVGLVEHKSNDETCLVIAGERQLFRKPHGKETSAETLIEIRHMLTRAGWSPDVLGPSIAVPPPETVRRVPDIVVVVEQRKAWVYRLDLADGDQHDEIIHSTLSPQAFHHLSHGDQLRDSSTEWASDPDFYARISQALHGSGNIVLVGHGKGHSNAARNLKAYLQRHHAAIFARLHSEIEADLSSLTDPQRRALGRKSLVTPETLEVGP